MILGQGGHSLLLCMSQALEVDMRAVRGLWSTPLLRTVGAILDYYSMD